MTDHFLLVCLFSGADLHSNRASSFLFPGSFQAQSEAHAALQHQLATSLTELSGKLFLNIFTLYPRNNFLSFALSVSIS